jgi:hypothetical protein
MQRHHHRSKDQGDTPRTRPSRGIATIARRWTPLLAATAAMSLPLAAVSTQAQASTGSTLTTASSASASYSGESTISSRSGGAWLRAQPNTGSYGIEYLGNGTHVLMLCWIDAQWATGNYSSNRWFRVEPAYDPNVGYVHSSLVANQVSVPHC